MKHKGCLCCVPRVIYMLTQGGVSAEFVVVAEEPLLSSPAVVTPLHNQVHLLELVLPHVPTEQPAPPGTAHRIAAVEGAAPHVPHAVGVDLWQGAPLAHEGVV